MLPWLNAEEEFWPIFQRADGGSAVSRPPSDRAALASLALEHGAVLLFNGSRLSPLPVGLKLIDPLEGREHEWASIAHQLCRGCGKRRSIIQGSKSGRYGECPGRGSWDVDTQ